jgi:tetraacyldisaccharide 4'-kinase
MFKVMDGSARGVGAALTRALLATAEPFYAAAMLLRNKSYDSGFRKVSRLDRPVISVGNVTTGGTGKTPIVRWLAEELRDEGRQVGILSRGYKAAPGQLADEMQMLDRSLNQAAARPVFLRAHPDRIAAGQSLLKEHPKIDLLLVDDGFQHRRLGRDFDLVLISAARPFGFGHVLPRGLLREPLRGLRRADAIVLTHADQVGAGELSRVESQLRRYGPGTPIYRAVHALTGLRSSRCASSGAPDHLIDLLSNRPFFAFCGIGTPDVLDSQLRRFGKQYVGRHWFPDHHRYTPGDLVALRTQAKNSGAEILVTTEKDWVKIVQLPESQSTPRILRIDMKVRFLDGSDARLLAQLRSISAPSRRG